MKEVLAIVQCGIKNEMPKRFINEIEKPPTDCIIDNDCPVIKNS